jgi:hypothetical protein
MSRDDSVMKILEVYQQPLIESLTESSICAEQPSAIKVPLHPHQLAMIHAMEEKEKSCIHGFRIKDEIHYSQFAILGDKVGSGKTLMMLGYLSHMKAKQPTKVYSRIHPFSKTSFWSESPVHKADCSGNTLIIVPHTLFHQWKHSITTQTNLSFCEVRTTKALEKPDFLELIKRRDITLMSNTIIKQFMSDSVFETVQWSRIIFDEVDNIVFTSTTQMPRANFYWLMSATWSNFLFNGLYMYMSESFLNRLMTQGIHSELALILQQEQLVQTNSYYVRYDIKSNSFFANFLTKHPARGHLVLRSSNAFMEQSWRSPPIVEERILCESPIIHRLVSSYVTTEIQELLHAGDVQTALQRLGVNNENPSSLINAVCESREKELERLEKTLTFKETMEYSSQQIKDQAIQSLKSKIQSIKDQLISLKERIINASNEICAICYDEPKISTFVMCCSRIFCGACILKCIQQKAICPLCRADLDYTRLRHLETDMKDLSSKTKKKETVVKLLKKKDALLKYITDSSGGKFLVFNRYDNPFIEIEGHLIEKGYRVASVRGNKDHVSNVLKQFETGDIKILLMNSTTAGVGMDLKSATHVILMHSMRKEEERQIIGRAMRLGRTTPLKLIRLLHEEERPLNI